MKGKKLLATFLLGVSLCFVPVLAHGEVEDTTRKEVEELLSMEFDELNLSAFKQGKASSLELALLEAKVDYIMENPTTFLRVIFYYDEHGVRGKAGVEGLPTGVDTKGKIMVTVIDTRGAFANKSGTALLEEFEKQLKLIYPYVWRFADNMDADIVGRFFIPAGRWRRGIALGYFYQGEYHLWERS